MAKYDFYRHFFILCQSRAESARTGKRAAAVRKSFRLTTCGYAGKDTQLQEG
jgi:hypothetical protein